MPRNTLKRSDCPISRTLDILGDKWTLLILRDIVFKGYNYYNEFLSSEEGIATNILANRLKLLEERQILKAQQVTNTKYNRLKARKEYKLTKIGIGLVPVILEMLVWGSRYDETTKVETTFFDKYLSDKEAVTNEIINSLEKQLHQNFC